MDRHAVPPPEYHVGGDPSVQTFVSKFLEESPERGQGHQASDNWKRLEDQALGDGLLKKICEVEKKFIFMQILMESSTS